MAYTFNDAAGRYRDESSGRFVSERIVRLVVDEIADHASEKMAQACQRLLTGELSLGSWQAEMQQTIKSAHLATITIAHGGAEQMTFSRYGSAGNEIKAQYQYLREFAAQIESGQQPLNGSLTARARQYGQASRVSFERAYSRDQRNRGYSLERNVLAPAEHCAQCKEQTARGWVPIGTLVPVGSRTCRGNCRCRLTYSTEAAVAA